MTESRSRLSLANARLEDRLTPAISLFYTAGNLNVTGVPEVGLSLARVGATGFNVQVKDGGTDYGTYVVSGNVRVNLFNYDADITFDLGDGTLPGNLSVNHSIGNVDPVDNAVEVQIYDGGIAGSVVYSGGQGREYLSVGKAGDGVTIGGDLRFTGRAGAGGDSDGNNLDVTDSSIARHLIASSAHRLNIVTASQVAGNVIATVPSAASEIGVILGDTSKVAGNFVVTGTSISNLGIGDQILIEQNALVAGDLTATLGDNLNDFQLLGTVNGNVTLIGGNGVSDTAAIPVNNVVLTGTVDGNLSVFLGNAVNTAVGGEGNLFDFGGGLGVVNGNVNLNFGNGTKNNLDGLGATGFDGTVNGDIDIRLGNAENIVTLNGVLNGGRVSYTGGSGTDQLVVAGAYTFLLTANLGAGADTFGLDNALSTVALGGMTIDFGVDFDTDVFDDSFGAGTTVTVTWPATLLNLP